MEYSAALDRAYDELPERPNAEESRLSVPDPVGESDGAFTRLNNVDEIADALGRDPDHLYRSLQSDLGTSGQFDGQRARFNGSFSADQFSAAIDRYVEEYVRCSECGLPDTLLTSEDGVDMLRCQACGAFRPVAKRSGAATETADRPAIEEGEVYEFDVTGTGRKGDGVAERGKYTIFVSGASEGETVRARVESVSGNLVFTQRV